MRTKKPESEQERAEAEFNWFTPEEAGKRIGGLSRQVVMERIKSGDIPAEFVRDISRGTQPRIKISQAGIDYYNRESTERVRELQEAAAD